VTVTFGIFQLLKKQDEPVRNRLIDEFVIGLAEALSDLALKLDRQWRLHDG
jgi:hypothetical protein